MKTVTVVLIMPDEIAAEGDDSMDVGALSCEGIYTRSLRTMDSTDDEIEEYEKAKQAGEAKS